MPRNQMTKNEKASATDKAGVALYKEKQVVFEGAIPHPDILKGYGEIDKSYPERIIKLAENHAKTEDASQSALVKGNIISVILGQILSFIFGIAGITATIYLGSKGNTPGAIATAIAVIVQVVVSAIVNKKN